MPMRRYGSRSLHGRFADKAEELSNELKEKLNIAKLEVMRISPVLGVHTGPSVVGAAVVPRGSDGWVDVVIQLIANRLLTNRRLSI